MQPKTISEKYSYLHACTDKVLAGGCITFTEAQTLIAPHNQEDIMMLLAHANLIRYSFKGLPVDLCAVVNAKSGHCPEDCIFCTQSAHYQTKVKTYPLLQKSEIATIAKIAETNGAHRFGIVTSGKGITNEKELEKICESIGELAQNSTLVACASLGILTSDQYNCLRKAGLKRFHHNLETAESHFSKICSTHSYQERVQSIRMAQKAGLEVCSGGIFGIGETQKQRIELAFTLKELDVDAVPLNFLNPVRGTPTENFIRLAPLEILKIIALFRFVLPQKDIRVCGGRELGLRTLQPMMYMAGANGTMVGNYLTTNGRDPQIDLQEILDLGLTSGPK